MGALANRDSHIWVHCGIQTIVFTRRRLNVSHEHISFITGSNKNQYETTNKRYSNNQNRKVQAFITSQTRLKATRSMRSVNRHVEAQKCLRNFAALHRKIQRRPHLDVKSFSRTFRNGNTFNAPDTADRSGIPNVSNQGKRSGLPQR